MKFEKIENTMLKETILHGVHESGLRVYIVPKQGFSKYYAIYGTEYGSIDTKLNVPDTDEVIELPDGIAHFLEHKLFEEEDGGNAFDRFALTGANSNAFTSFDMTAYLFSCTDSFYENLDILIDFVNHPYFTDENVAKEQGIIGQEIKMYDDDPNWRLFFNMLQGMYFKNPVKTDIAGTVESIAKITPDLLFKCCDAFYNPSNMFLVMVGDIDADKAMAIVDKYVTSERDRGRIEREIVDEPKTVAKSVVYQKMSVSKPQFMIGFKELETDITGTALLKKQIETNVILSILFGKSSEFFTELYEAGIIDGSFSFECELEKKYGFSSVSGESKDPNEVFNRVIKRIEEVKSKGFDEDEISRVKKVLIGANLRGYNDVERIGNNFIRSFMSDVNPFEYERIAEAVEKDALEKRLREHFNKDAAVLSVIEPLDGEE
ncbi:MAG: insulinase family protein [Clostridia bacterium]|nr:insulinase family protein [Clostridia bacterium]